MPFPKPKDPSITFLNKYGYNVVRLPRTGIEPMDIVARDEQDILNLGPLSKVWSSPIPEPQPKPPRPTSAVNGMKTDALDVSFGLKVLADALAAFGVSAPSFNVAYQGAHSVHFAYTNVTTTSVEPFDVGSYLGGNDDDEGKLQTGNPQVANYFLNPNAKTYIILDVLKSDSITVSATDSNGVGVTLDVPAIQGVVGANVAVKPSSSSSSEVTFTGPAALTFGFAVQQIVRVGDKWVLHGAKPSGNIAFAVPGAKPADAATPTIFDTGELDCRVNI
jgi:hypothetical protein